MTLNCCSSTRANLIAVRVRYPIFFSEYIPLISNDLKTGWLGPGHWWRDTSDQEWYAFTEILIGGMPLLAVHFIGAQYLRKTNKQVVI
jgi:hypothetical protein